MTSQSVGLDAPWAPDFLDACRELAPSLLWGLIKLMLGLEITKSPFLNLQEGLEEPCVGVHGKSWY